MGTLYVVRGEILSVITPETRAVPGYGVVDILSDNSLVVGELTLQPGVTSLIWCPHEDIASSWSETLRITEDLPVVAEPNAQTVSKIVVVGKGAEPDYCTFQLLHDKPVHAFDPVYRCWSELAPLRTLSRFQAAAKIGERLVLFSNSTSRCLTPASNKWQNAAINPGYRDLFAVAWWHEALYLAGGVVSGGCATTQVYHYTDHWRAKAPLFHRRYGHGLVSQGDYMYAIGGFSSLVMTLSSVERYDPRANEWQSMASMADPRGDFGVAVVGRSVYVLGGGQGGGLRISSCERYDVDRNTWRPISSLQAPLTDVAACAYEATIFVFGNYNGTTRVQQYDTASDTWVDAGPMPPGLVARTATLMPTACLQL